MKPPSRQHITTTTRRPRAAQTGPDELADALASKLKITGSSSSTSRRPAPPPTTAPSPRDVRADSMRAVNAAMQGMSALAQTGWRKSSVDTTGVWRSRNAEANHLAATSREHLATLRGIDGATVEIERAALSVVGKLVAMDMRNAERLPLDPLCSLAPPSLPLPHKPNLPLPPPPHKPSHRPVHLTMLSTYLIHALTTTCSTLSPSDTPELARTLTHPNSPSILEWLPHFHPLPQKHVDSLLTRAYTAITKTCSARPSHPVSKSTSSTSSKPTSSSSKPTPSSSKPTSSKPTTSKPTTGQEQDPTSRPHHATYTLRAYALRCLASASPGTVAPDSFWDQSTRFTASFVKSSTEFTHNSTPTSKPNDNGSGAGKEGLEEEEDAKLVLSTLDGIVRTAEARPDAGTFLDGTKFFAFCDYWISFAKWAGDITSLDRIARLVRKVPSTSLNHTPPPNSASPSPLPSDTPSAEECERAYPSLTEVISEGTKIHATLVQAVSQADGVLDGTSSDDTLSQSCSSTLTTHAQALTPLLLASQTTAPYKADPDFLRVAGKVDRALERLRRTLHKLLELPRSSAALKTSASAVLKTCVGTLRVVLSETIDVDLRGDVTTRAIDSLFVLGRTTLDVSNPQSYIPAYDYLDEALGILSAAPAPSINDHRAAEGNAREGNGESGGREGGSEEEEMDVPNYLRCVSGAFYNLAGALYQGGRYGAAVPFLRRACEVGERALEGHRARARTKSESEIVSGGKGKGKENGNERERGKEKEREREAEWTQLDQQLYRRWELLAVCYLKNGDRKNSYDAFVNCIRVFPFGSVNLASESDTTCPSALFSSPSSSSSSASGDASALKPLASLLDRTTYVGACELLLPPSQVSLLHITTTTSSFPSLPSLPSQFHSAPHTHPTSPPTSSLHPRHDDARVVGALLEQQYEALFVHRWKEGARGVLVQLLRDALGVYARAGVSVSAGADTRMDVDEDTRMYVEKGRRKEKEREEGGCAMPVRRARVLLKALEFAYQDVEEPGSFVREIGFESMEELGGEVLGLLAPTTDLNLDVGLGVYKTQYAASAHLWLANLAHRASPSDVLSVVSAHVGAATALLESMHTAQAAALTTSSSALTKNGKVTSPATGKRMSGVVVGGMGSPRATRSGGRAMRGGPPPAPRKAAPVRRAPAPRTKVPVTPKAKGRSVQAVTVTVRTPTRVSTGGGVGVGAMPFDNFAGFHDLLMLTTRILGLLSLVLPRFQLLAFLRKLTQRQLGSASEESIIASLELAYEYAKLGKLKRATSVFTNALDIVRSGQTAPEVAAFFLLRFSETLALMGDVPRSSAVYLEAFEHSDRMVGEQRGMSSVVKIQMRARRLELSAMACRVFGLIQNAREDGTLALSSLLQSLRLWNRAIDTTARLARSSSSSKGSSDTSGQNPFESSATSNLEGDSTNQTQPTDKSKVLTSSKTSTELQWRFMEGLISVLFSLADAYLTRGSPREAEYFLKQVQTLGEAAGLPVIEARAVLRMVDVQLGLGRLEEAARMLGEAAARVGEGGGGGMLDGVEYQRVRARYDERAEEREAASEGSVRALEMLRELDGDFRRLDGVVTGLRKSLEAQDAGTDSIVPELLSNVLCRYIWLRRENGDQEFDSLLNKLCSLPSSSRIEAQRNSLMANLTLHNVHQRFQSDMFLNSLTESTIAIPMGMSSKNNAQRALPIYDVLSALDSAEKYFQESISLTSRTGDVLHFRDAAVSLTLVKAFQTSLGRLDELNAGYASSLLDASSAITLRREMLEAIQQKLAALKPSDDFEWPMISEDGTPKPLPAKEPSRRRPMLLGDSDIESDDDEDPQNEKTIREYWESVQERYQAKLLDTDSLRSSQTKDLPANWTIIHVHLAEDKSTLLISRQECGEEAVEPLLFCVPLKGRRDNGTGDEEEHLSFEDAVAEFMEIIRLSNESTKAAVQVRADDDEARSNWWKERNALDVRLKELLENIEFCWLGAFKTILSPRSNLTAEQLDELRAQFDKVFQRNLHVKDKKTKARAGHRKAASQSQAPSQVYLDDAMLRCFSALSPKCREEELEDLLYFILDLYQFHGVPVVTAEVDSMQAVVDLRAVLEEHNGRLQRAKGAKVRSASRATPVPREEEEHIFLVLDKNVQGLPWESLPSLRGRSVSRIPCIDFLHDRIAFASLKREQNGLESRLDGTAAVNAKNGYFILNPSGDLTKTQGRFKDWVDGMKKLGWDGVVGQAVTEQQFSDALRQRDLVVYFGHGGGEQYIRSQRIRGLPTCAATMLWGCSSGALKEMGDYDRIGTPYNYMLGGCPTLIANLWDVTDRDIDKFSMAVFDKIGLNGSLGSGTAGSSPSVITAVAQSREVCKLKYLTGAAPVVYGIPFYL
ncbi:cysteine peptidase C50 [Ephemerocybe angulata]|uniref:separase n=1 Tax=Ephemerocybe angulata TaxID=980116 RepID=A0A8H6IHG3_9AGAR|nr:cysteine peptidase C50 [Tulosesus angulatus]